MESVREADGVRTKVVLRLRCPNGTAKPINASVAEKTPKTLEDHVEKEWDPSRPRPLLFGVTGALLESTVNIQRFGV